MKIGIDISQSVYKGTGSARFTEGLIHSIFNHSDIDWIFFFSALRQHIDNDIKQDILDHNFKLKQFLIPPKLLHYLWNTLHVVPVDRLIGEADWFITSDWTQPPFQGNTATLVHDMVFKLYPETVDPFVVDVQQKRIEWAKKESALFLALSDSTKDDLIRFFDIDSNRIIVNYPGVDVVEPTQKDIELVKTKYNIDRPFILTVGKIEPRKNLKRLIEAFGELKNKDIELLIVGPKGWDTIQTDNRNIRFLGFVSDRDLSALYKTAEYFVFPSIYEGFGYPAVEAMKLGCPVTMSKTSSLEYIGKDASLLFDPLNVDEIRSSLEKMINDKKLRSDLASKGLKKSKLFTWTNYYTTLIKAIEKYS